MKQEVLNLAMRLFQAIARLAVLLLVVLPFVAALKKRTAPWQFDYYMRFRVMPGYRPNLPD